MPTCSICSRSAKHAHMTVADKSYNFCCQGCMDIGLHQINSGELIGPLNNGYLQNVFMSLSENFGAVDLLSLSVPQAIDFCKTVIGTYCNDCTERPDVLNLTTWEESYIKEACLPAVGRLPFITIETAVPVIIDAFEKECFSEIPF